jgi:hypothetical protein
MLDWERACPFCDQALIVFADELGAIPETFDGPITRLSCASADRPGDPERALQDDAAPPPAADWTV